jgi:hypothetical protein
MMSGFGWPDALGTAGVVLILTAYAGTIAGRLPVSDLRYSLANAIGAAAILVSLFYSFNWASFLIEIAWLAISFYGIWRALSARPPNGRA